MFSPPAHPLLLPPTPTHTHTHTPPTLNTADGFAEVFPEHKYLIVDLLQKGGHIVGMTGDGVNDAPALKKADVGIAVQGATDAASAAADIVLTDSGLSTIIMGINIARQIFQRMKNYCIYRISATIQILFFFLLSIIIYDFKLPVFVIVLISIINDGTIITIAYDNVQASPRPEKWNLPVVIGVALVLGSVSVLGTYFMLFLALPREPDNMEILCTNATTMVRDCVSYLEQTAGLGLPVLEMDQVQALIYLQLSLSGQLTVFSARTRGWFFSRMPGMPLVFAFVAAQTCSTLLAIYPLGELQPMLGLACSGPDGECKPPAYSINPRNGWAYAGVVWAYCLLVFVFQDIAKQVTYGILQWKDAAEEEKKATLRMQRENRLKEDEVRPRRDPASSWERAKMRERERSKSRHMSAASARSAYGSSNKSDMSMSSSVFTNLTASGDVLIGGGEARGGGGAGKAHILSTSSLSTANVPEVLQSLLRRVQSLEEELGKYKKKS
jgi:H+-transporting ATPase